MAIDLTLSSETEATLTDEQLDSNFSAIETAVNALTPLTTTSFNTQLVLRSVKGTTLSNDELDSNFVYLDSRANNYQLNFEQLTQVTLPAIHANIDAELAVRQPLNDHLTSLSGVSTAGLLFLDGSTSEVKTRTITAGSEYIVVTDGAGTAGNPSIDIGSRVVTNSSTHTLTNKTLSGETNIFTNISVDSVVGVVPFAKGGTNATTAAGARASMSVFKDTLNPGIAVKTATDTTVARQIEVSGVGLAITNPDGVNGNPSISSNATSTNTASTVVSRDASGNFSASQINANLFVGSLDGNATTVTNGVYTTNSYVNPSWLTSLAGTKVTGIPNSSLDNNSMTFVRDGVSTTIPLGGTYTLDPSSAQMIPNQLVRRDSYGNFAANLITGDLLGNATTADEAIQAQQATKLSTPRTINGVPFDGTANITVYDPTKLSLNGGSLSDFLYLHTNPVHPLAAAPKIYVDQRDEKFTYGTNILSTQTQNGGVTYFDVFPPDGYAMTGLKAFLPAFGSSFKATPTYSTNLILAFDISGSANSTAIYEGVTYADAWQAGIHMARDVLNKYVTQGPVAVMIVVCANTTARSYEWMSSDAAAVWLNDSITKTNKQVRESITTAGGILNGWNSVPQVAAQNVCYFFTDCNHDLSVGSAFGSSEAAWRNFLNSHRMVSYAICCDNGGRASYANEIAWDGRSATNMNAFRSMSLADIPLSVSYGIYNTASISWAPLPDRVRVTLAEDMEIDISNVSVNWMAVWGF